MKLNQNMRSNHRSLHWSLFLSVRGRAFPVHLLFCRNLEHPELLPDVISDFLDNYILRALITNTMSYSMIQILRVITSSFGFPILM